MFNLVFNQLGFKLTQKDKKKRSFIGYVSIFAVFPFGLSQFISFGHIDIVQFIFYLVVCGFLEWNGLIKPPRVKWSCLQKRAFNFFKFLMNSTILSSPTGQRILWKYNKSCSQIPMLVTLVNHQWHAVVLSPMAHSSAITNGTQ